jgi:hypothetical protein
MNLAVAGNGRRIVACLGLVVLVFAACAPTPLGVAPPTAPPVTTPASAAVPTSEAGTPTPIPITTSATPAVVLPGTAAPNFPVQIVGVELNTVKSADLSTTLSNVSSDPVDLGGWVLLYGSYQVIVPSTQYVTLAPGSPKTLHLASSVEAPNGTDIYLGYSSLQMTPLLIPNEVLVLLNPQRQLISATSVPPATN